MHIEYFDEHGRRVDVVALRVETEQAAREVAALEELYQLREEVVREEKPQRKFKFDGWLILMCIAGLAWIACLEAWT